MEHAAHRAAGRRRARRLPARPGRVYLAMQRAIGTCLLDQYLPDNPLTMGDHGYEASDARAPPPARSSIVLRRHGSSTRPRRWWSTWSGSSSRACAPAIADFDEARARGEIIAGSARCRQRSARTCSRAATASSASPSSPIALRLRQLLLAYALYPGGHRAALHAAGGPGAAEQPGCRRAPIRGRPAAALPAGPRHGRLARHAGGHRSLDRLWFPHFARCLRAAAPEPACA